MRKVEVKVFHQQFGIGEIVEIKFHDSTPCVVVRWGNGRTGCHTPDQLEFNPVYV